MDKSNLSQKITIVLITILSLIFFFLLKPELSYDDPDAYWHIELGQYMIENKTIIDEGIHTFSEEPLTYVAHEVGFQLLLAFFYNIGGWNTVYIFTMLCLGFTIWGMYRLGQISRKEVGLDIHHPFLFIFVLFVTELIYMMYFTSRPQMLSTPIIVWFFVWLRRFQMNPNMKKIGILFLLSLALANVHGGVWLIIVVFFIMTLLESIFYKKLTKYHFIAFIMIIIGGILNTGGLDTILYILTVSSPFSAYNSEWQPLNFASTLGSFMVVVVFVWASAYLIKEKKNLFYLIFMTGILYLGLANSKQHLYLILFLPYFASVAIEYVPIFDKFKEYKNIITAKYMAIVTLVGLSIATLIGLFTPYKPLVDIYPVKEMEFINEHHEKGRPKVLTDYVVSGYVMFSGGNILTDGRFDPFIAEETKGIYDWTAFERSINAMYDGDYLLEIIEYDKPDYLILPQLPNEEEIKKVSHITPQYLKMKNAIEQLGEPDFTGDYGNVWHFEWDK